MDIPNYDFEKVECENGLTLYLNNDPTLATTTISVRVHGPYNEDSNGSTFIPSLLFKGSKQYPSQKELSRATDDNYGMSLGSGADREGTECYYSVGTNVVNKAILDGDTSDPIVTGISILKDVLNNPYNATDAAFNQKYFDLVERDVLRGMSTTKEDIGKYASSRFKQIAFEGHPMASTLEEDLDYVKHLKNEDVYSAYKTSLKSGNTEVYVSGNFDRDQLVDQLKDLVPEGPKDMRKGEETVFKGNNREIIEREKADQTQLFIGYGLDRPSSLEESTAMVILGNILSNRLFKTVREEHSLCYTTYASLNGTDGYLSCYAGVEDVNYEKTRDLITKEVRNIIEDKNFTVEDVKHAQQMIINGFQRSMVSPLSRIDNVHAREHSITGGTIDDLFEAFAQRSYDDVVAVTAHVDLDNELVYGLRKEEDGDA